LKHHPALLVGVNRPLHACHFSTPWRWAGLLSQQLLNRLGVRGGDDHLARQPAGAPARLVLEQVLAVRATAHHLSGTGQPEALVRSAVRLHLWHARRRLSLLRALRRGLILRAARVRHAARSPFHFSADKPSRRTARPRRPPRPVPAPAPCRASAYLASAGPCHRPPAPATCQRSPTGSTPPAGPADSRGLGRRPQARDRLSPPSLPPGLRPTGPLRPAEAAPQPPPRRGPPPPPAPPPPPPPAAPLPPPRAPPRAA